MRALTQRLIAIENVIHRELVRHSVMALRLAVGAIFLGFGMLKFFPGVSPAQNLTETTTHLLFLGVVPARAGLVAVATLECFIGVCLLSGRWMRLAIWLLATEFVGILSPLFLLSGRLFSGPHNAPTLEGQYVLKDITLVAAGMVIAAATFRGGRLVRDEPQLAPVAAADRVEHFDAARKVQVVFDGASNARTVAELCEAHGISQSVYFRWRDQAIEGATQHLAEAQGAAVPGGS